MTLTIARSPLAWMHVTKANPLGTDRPRERSTELLSKRVKLIYR
jgi:hypothetical protein